MVAYYNEFDPAAAATLRELMGAGVIAPGDIDERSIEDVRPDDVRPYTQCHFFAGIGVWSYALRLAGWPDDCPVWTGSEPCQPHSSAGKGLGATDKRYLRWAWHHIIEHGKRPDIPVFGEQVASSDGLAWLDTLSADMEGAGHSCRAFDLCAAGFGAPHIRQRLFWVADTKSIRIRSRSRNKESQGFGRDEFANSGRSSGMADMQCAGLERQSRHGNESHESGWNESQPARSAAKKAFLGRLGNPDSKRCEGQRVYVRQRGQNEEAAKASRRGEAIGLDNSISERQRQRQGRDGDNREYVGQQFRADVTHGRPGPTNGFWQDVDWLFCRDERWRPVESGSFPLVDGTPARVQQLRMFGNAINAVQASYFIKAYRECIT